MQEKRIALAGFSPDVAQRDCSHWFPGYGIRRIQAAIVADPALGQPEVLLIDERDFSLELMLDRILSFEPDLLGLSTYVWSFGGLMELARLVKQSRPGCSIVAGGPSARPRMFDLDSFSKYRDSIDALVLADGEEAVRAIAAAGDMGKESLKAVSGLAIPSPDGWVLTPERVPDSDLDTIASPFQMSLMPRGNVAYVETFRGCPLSCSFCQWGIMDSKRKFSKEYLVRELNALKVNSPVFSFLVDAALNLNLPAFRNLAAAEEEAGFFRQTPLLCEVYPTLLKEEHLEFLERCRDVHVGLGVQSLDPQTLNAVSRRCKLEFLATVVRQLSGIGLVDVEIILGLPGDTPESFRRTLEQALQLPCNVRVYKCLVLPDALMTRAPKEFDVRFDPQTLIMTSCHTWSEKQLRETYDYVSGLAQSMPSTDEGAYFWHFTSSLPKYQAAYAALSNPMAGEDRPIL
jgi:radical SAM superfamily enzyme YgiQ (UPF0313 family)